MAKTKSERIAAAMFNRHGDPPVLPPAACAALAVEFDCSRELVRLVSVKLNATILTAEEFYGHETPCTECGTIFHWTRDRQNDQRFHGTPAVCSASCGHTSKWRRLGARDIRADYSDQELICPVCDTPFVWTTEQQLAHSRNVAQGRISFPELPPCCSRPCKSTQGRLHGVKYRRSQGLPLVAPKGERIDLGERHKVARMAPAANGNPKD